MITFEKAIILTIAIICLLTLGAFAGWNSAAAKPAKYVKITPSFGVEVPTGGTKQFTAVAEDENAIKLDPQPTIVWTQSAPCMKIDSSGLLTVEKGGGCGGEVRATVTNTDGSKVFGKVGVFGKP